MKILAAIIIGYFLGSIPFALVIGKLFFQKDIRNYGSKNLGGGNAGRVLGKKAGLAVMTLDLLKVTLAIFLTSLFANDEIILILAGLSAAAGHCFPVFANFKGGKAVATMYGFLFGMALVGGYGLKIFFFPLIVFLIVLYLWKIIAEGSTTKGVATLTATTSLGGFDPVTINVFDLPQKGVNINLPALPAYSNYYGFRGDLYTTMMVIERQNGYKSVFK